MRSAPNRARRIAQAACAIGVCLIGLTPATADTPATAAGTFPAAAEVLERRCLACHAGSAPKGELSLATPEFLGREDLVDRASPSRSGLLAAVTPVDGAAEMPKDAEPLTPTELQAINAWLQAGTPWPDRRALERPLADLDWWSLRPLSVPSLPTELTPSDFAGTSNPIDLFIAARLREHALQPSPEADRRTLIRRLFFDLLGLPPTPPEVESFAADRRVDAYERLVDRLLSRPEYGERWARHWLDVVHYGETHGYDKDKPRPHAWPYRDYVIRRLNQDVPYSRFVREQIAGDMWWPHDPRAIEATGFIAAGPWDFIGHAEVPETKIDGQVARNLDRDDMVTSTMNTFVSTTVQCARCHNHKFDLVSQEHYYSLQAVFAAVDRTDREYDTDPVTAARRAELNRHIAAVTQRMDALKSQRQQLSDDPQLQAAVDELAIDDHPHQGYHSRIETTDSEAKWVQIDLGHVQPVAGVLIFPCHDGFAGIGDGFGFPLRFKVEACRDAEFGAHVITLADYTQHDIPNPGQLPFACAAPEAEPVRFVRVTATKLAPRQQDYIFALAEMAVLNPAFENIALAGSVTALDAVDGGERWRHENLIDGQAYQLSIADADLASILHLALARQARLDSDVLVKLDRELASLVAEQTSWQSLRDELPAPLQVYAGGVHHGTGAFRGTGPDGGQPRAIHVLMRGEVTQPGQLVSPGTIPIVPAVDWQFHLPPDHHEGDRRKALADWIVRADNPLTWRSIANRLWLYHFGTGLVGSPNDFGRMGELPSHPQLLDWLACELRDHGESWKHVHRLIVTSRTYRQSSAESSAFDQIDSSNQFYWRMNRRALDAEAIRDSVLAVAGRLNGQMYGPSFQDFVIDKPEHSPHYEYDLHDPADVRTHRRSVYRFLVRSQPQPFMDTLDCADPSQSVPRRQTTLTPLQALALLNNRFVLTMSEEFAKRLEAESSDRARQVTRAFRLCMGREPSEAEQQALHGYCEQYGLTNTCRCIVNLNEFVFID